MRMLTIPSVARASYTRLALNCLWSPVFCVWAIGMYDKTLGPTFPVWGLALIVGATALPLMLFFNKPRVFPHVHLVFTFWNFIVSIVWLNTLVCREGRRRSEEWGYTVRMEKRCDKGKRGQGWQRWKPEGIPVAVHAHRRMAAGCEGG